MIVTLATLTGAVVVAFGERFAGLFVKDNLDLRDILEKIGKDSGDLVWPLPLTEDNEREVEGHFADITNTSKKNLRYGGASTAAGFLSKFAGENKFAHIDMAPRMTSVSDEDILPRGAIGFGVAYLTELANQWAEVQKHL